MFRVSQRVFSTCTRTGVLNQIKTLNEKIILAERIANAQTTYLVKLTQDLSNIEDSLTSLNVSSPYYQTVAFVEHDSSNKTRKIKKHHPSISFTNDTPSSK